MDNVRSIAAAKAGSIPGSSPTSGAVVGILCYKALFEAHIGEITSSRATMAEAISLAEELKDMYGLAVTLGFATTIEVAEHNLAEVERYSSDLIELSTRHHFALYLAVAG
jgi:hypothetical protein